MRSMKLALLTFIRSNQSHIQENATYQLLNKVLGEILVSLPFLDVFLTSFSIHQLHATTDLLEMIRWFPFPSPVDIIVSCPRNVFTTMCIQSSLQLCLP